MDEHIPEDGGWGWMVVLGAAIINMVNQALFSVFGLIFGEELKEMAHGKATGITLVMAVSVCVTNFSGLAVGPLMKTLSVRTITVFGIICVGSGMIMSSFATEIWHIVISYGIFTGLGLGLVASSTFLAINEYFTTRKSTAVGLSMAGTSIGQMIMPIFVGLLLKQYEFSGTTRILGTISCCGILGALCFKPLFCCKKQKQRAKEMVTEVRVFNSQKDFKELNSNQSITKKEQMILQNAEMEKLLTTSTVVAKKPPKDQSIENNNLSTSKGTEVEQSKAQSILKKIIQIFDLELLTDFRFVHIAIGLSLAYVSSISFSTFFPMFLQDEVNFTMWETTSCMTALSAADILGRMTISEICRKLGLGNRSAFMCGAVILAACRSCIVASSSYKYVLISSIVTGYFRAATIINQNLVISEYISKEKLPAAVGLNMVAKGIAVMSIGEPMGLLKDAFDYSICIHLLDVVLLVITLSWSLEIFISKKVLKAPIKDNCDV